MLQSSVPTSKPCASASSTSVQASDSLPTSGSFPGSHLPAIAAGRSLASLPRDSPVFLVSTVLPYDQTCQNVFVAFECKNCAYLFLDYSTSSLQICNEVFLKSIYELTIELSGQCPKILCSETKYFLSPQERHQPSLLKRSLRWIDDTLFWLHALSMVGSFFSCSVKSPSELSAPSSVLLGCPSLAVLPFPLQCSADLLACLPFVPWHLQPILQSTFTT